MLNRCPECGYVQPLLWECIECEIDFQDLTTCPDCGMLTDDCYDLDCGACGAKLQSRLDQNDKVNPVTSWSLSELFDWFAGEIKLGWDDYRFNLLTNLLLNADRLKEEPFNAESSFYTKLEDRFVECVAENPDNIFRLSDWVREESDYVDFDAGRPRILELVVNRYGVLRHEHYFPEIRRLYHCVFLSSIIPNLDVDEWNRSSFLNQIRDLCFVHGNYRHFLEADRQLKFQTEYGDFAEQCLTSATDDGRLALELGTISMTQVDPLNGYDYHLQSNYDRRWQIIDFDPRFIAPKNFIVSGERKRPGNASSSLRCVTTYRVWNMLLGVVLRDSGDATAEGLLGTSDINNWVSLNTLADVGQQVGIVSMSSEPSPEFGGSPTQMWWSPLNRLAKSLRPEIIRKLKVSIQSICDASLRDLALSMHPWRQLEPFKSLQRDDCWGPISARTIQIVLLRSIGKNTRQLTLEEVGREFGITRERVRQVEKNFWSMAHRFGLTDDVYERLLGCLFLDFFDRGGSVLIGTDRVNDPHRLFLAKMLGIPVSELKTLDLSLLGSIPLDANAFDLRPTPSDHLHSFFDEQEIANELSDVLSSHITEFDIGIVAKRLYQRRIEKALKPEKVYLALYALGEASHFSEVTRSYNELFPDDISTSRTVHATLGKYQYGVVYLQQKGMYGLTEWGDFRPDIGLHEAATKAVTDLYIKTREPIHIDILESAILELRPLAEGNLSFITVFNPALKSALGPSFVPRLNEYRPTDEQIYLSYERLKTAASEENARNHDNSDWLYARPYTMLSGPELSKGTRNGFESIGEDITIRDLDIFLYTAQGKENVENFLTTNRKLTQIQDAVIRFEDDFVNFMTGKWRSPRFHWIVPDKYLDENMTLSKEGHSRVVESLGLTGNAQWDAMKRTGTPNVEWVSYLSLEILGELDRLRVADHLILGSAFAKFALDQYEIIEGMSSPLDDRVDFRIKALSSFVLTSYDSTPRLADLLTKFRSSGCVNIGQLVSIDLPIKNLIEAIPLEKWRSFYTAMQS